MEILKEKYGEWLAFKDRCSRTGYGRIMLDFIFDWVVMMELKLILDEVNQDSEAAVSAWLEENCFKIGGKVKPKEIDSNAFSVAFGEIGSYWQYGHLLKNNFTKSPQ
jgi:hypothetical protein